MNFHHLYKPKPGFYIPRQLLLIMKLTTLIIFLAIMQISASTTAQTVTLSEKNVSLESVLKKIGAQTGYDFFGDTRVIRAANPVSINVKNAPLNEVLRLCMLDQLLSYAIEEKTIIIKQLSATAHELSGDGQQVRTIEGTVVSEDGEIPLANATILALGSSVKTYTNKEGKFSINIPETVKTLRINYVGYDSRDVKIEDKTRKITVRMVTQNNSLKEFVVRTGVYKRPVENFTGSAKTITAEELKRVSSQNILAAISILDPSVQLPENINLGSDPNQLPDIELRGQNNFPQSTSNTALKNAYGDKPNAPLFILDGFQVPLQRIYDLDMNRVERITILKDAAATSIYGSRASNGVIIIDTRQPKEGSVRVSYRGGVTMTTPDLTSYDLLNAKDKLNFEKEVGFYNEPGNSPFLQILRDQEYNERLKDVTRGVDTYWLSQPLRTAYGNSHSLYLEGGDPVVRYGINLNSQNDQAVMKKSGREKVSGGVTLTYRTPKLLFGNDLSVNSVKATNSPYGSFSDYSKLNQYWTPYDEDGQLLKFLGQGRRNVGGGPLYNYYSNPLYNASLPSKDFNRQLGFTNNFKFEWSVQPWIRITGGASYTHNTTSADKYLSSNNTIFEDKLITERGSYKKSNGTSDLIDANLGFDIRKNWNKNLIYVTGNVNVNEGKLDESAVTVIGFPNEKVSDLIFGSKFDPTKNKPIGTQGITRLISSRLNINYAFDNKYLLDLSASADASSQFGKDKQLAPFWSLGMGWNLHREEFISKLTWVNFLKIRGSVGTTGDQNFPPYMALTTYDYFNQEYYLDQLSAFLMGYGNSALGWQKSFKKSIGLDATFLNNRLALSADFYHNTTDGLILDVSTPPSLGFSSYKENMGALKNVGWQASLNYAILQKPRQQLFWRVGLSAYGNRNTIDKISNALKKLNEKSNTDDQDLNNPNRNKPKSYYQEGESLTRIFAVRSLGIDPANGQELFLDRNGNATYVWNSLDKVAVGDTNPKVTGTLSTGVDYKGFGFNIYMTYRLGADLYNQTLVDRIENANITYNVDRRIATERWRNPGDRTFFKGIVGNTGNSPVAETTLATSRFVQKEYTLEASRLSFTYQFPERSRWLKKANLSNTRIEFYMATPFRLSSIKRERGLDYPFAQSYTLNLSTSIF
ncbi:SusC/RagA family TonB-linked outer membrane protein [Pedobacter sp. KBW06]|nr:SusC/RagA family TonB-linked outer membrane protein [Pedobacter sp. KBW06]